MPVILPKHPPWKSQMLVIGALLHREVVTRFGKYHLGLLWLVLQPLLGVIVVGLLLGPIIGRTSPDMPYAFFLLNGFVLLRMFVGPLNSGMKALGANQGLLVFPKVQPLDPFIARFVFELVSGSLSFVVFCLVAAWMGITLSLGSLHVLLACFLITWLAGCGCGLLTGVGVARFRELERIVPFLLRPLIFISCVLAPLFTLPGAAREILLYNPLVHTIELSRKALFPLYHATGVNLLYPALVAVVVFALGICVLRNNRHFLTQP